MYLDWGPSYTGEVTRFWALFPSVLFALALILTPVLVYGDELIVPRLVAQIVVVDLKNDAGLLLNFVLGKKIDIPTGKASTCAGTVFGIEGKSSGFFSVGRYNGCPFLEKLISPKGFYAVALRNASVDPVIKIHCQWLLHEDNGASAVESAKVFAAEIFKVKTGEIEPGGGGTFCWTTKQEYPVERWSMASDPILLSNRVKVILITDDKLVRVGLSLIVVRREGDFKLEVCEVDVKRKPSHSN